MIYEAFYYRNPLPNEIIGPVLEHKIIKSNTNKDAMLTARNIAKQYDWRLLELRREGGK
uniref:Uncharacterized protein n=1 Tax=viral metagenome TaxID=1070528 RepID=A0A6M3JRH8_9ZZZZ